MIDWWSFILGVIIGLAGMIIEAFAWRVSCQEDREIFDGQIRRRERIIDALITEVTRLKEEKEMTLDEALLVLSNRAEDQLGKLEVLLKSGGSLRATDEAMEIARECIKRCRDFEVIRSAVGKNVYFASFDENFPDESCVSEFEILDISVNGLVRIDNGEWINMADPDELMFWTREEAEEKLEELKHEMQQM